MEFHTRGIEDYSDEELYAELERRRIDNEVIRVNTLTINKITVKDFVVEIDSGPEAYGSKPYFVFYLKHSGKKYDIYSDYSSRKKWWPKNHQGLDNAAYDFIPQGFREAVENGYEFNGSVDDGIKYLKKCGFWNIKKL